MTDSALLREPDPSAVPEAAIDRFLKRNTRAYLFVKTQGGEVRGWPLTSMYRPGLVCFTTYRKSAKTPYLAAADEAAVVIATPEGAAPMDYVSISGPIRVLDFTPELVERLLALQPGTETRADESVKQRFRQRLADGKRVLIEVDVREARMQRLEEDAA